MPVDARVRIETTLLPPLDLSLSGGGSEPNLAMRVLRPKVTVTVNGQPLYVAAPLGAPGPTRWPTVRLLLLAGAVVLGWRLVRLVL